MLNSHMSLEISNLWFWPFKFPTHQPMYPSSASLQTLSSTAFLQCHINPPAPACSPPSVSPPLFSSIQPRVVYVQWNLGLWTKLSWLFLLWGGSPLSVVTAAKYVMFSLFMPKHTPSKLIDGKITLGGMEGWEVEKSTQETEQDPEVRRCSLHIQPVMKIKIWWTFRFTKRSAEYLEGIRNESSSCLFILHALKHEIIILC